jgi:hypothetical protein
MLESSAMPSSKNPLFNTFMQVGLVGTTMIGLLLVSMKMPAHGLLVNLVAQIFWFYSSYHAWKEANQIGVFVNTILYTLIVIYGVVNYWFL